MEHKALHILPEHHLELGVRQRNPGSIVVDDFLSFPVQRLAFLLVVRLLCLDENLVELVIPVKRHIPRTSHNGEHSQNAKENRDGEDEPPQNVSFHPEGIISCLREVVQKEEQDTLRCPALFVFRVSGNRTTSQNTRVLPALLPQGVPEQGPRFLQEER